MPIRVHAFCAWMTCELGSHLLLKYSNDQLALPYTPTYVYVINGYEEPTCSTRSLWSSTEPQQKGNFTARCQNAKIGLLALPFFCSVASLCVMLCSFPRRLEPDTYITAKAVMLSISK